jgi:hypothetical protein
MAMRGLAAPLAIISCRTLSAVDLVSFWHAI